VADTIVVSAQVPIATCNRIDAAAMRRRATRSELIRFILEAVFENDEAVSFLVHSRDEEKKRLIRNTMVSS